MENLSEDLVVSVSGEDKFPNDDLVDQVKVSISQIFDAEDRSLGTTTCTFNPEYS